MICASLYRVYFIKISSDWYAEKILLVNTAKFRGDYLEMAFLIEIVVNRRMNGDKHLQTSHTPEP